MCSYDFVRRRGDFQIVEASADTIWVLERLIGVFRTTDYEHICLVRHGCGVVVHATEGKQMRL